MSELKKYSLDSTWLYAIYENKKSLPKNGRLLYFKQAIIY